ncbi:MAG TPA: helix-turn-helix domain-containing protein, partial [Acidimicrobiales bacterium]|nr:helix-turn-helix domain-containing protein [Acidimicrobiales bacterium]
MATTRRTQAERSATTKAALLAAARELFAENGFAATGRDDIAERAGVTRGALYHHYDSKEALLRAVVLEMEREL